MTIDDLERFGVSAPATNPASASAVLAKDTAFYIFTSGTTGFPKASVMTHRRWLAALAAFGGMGLRLKASDTLYSCLPLYHNNALTVALSSVINSGATLALGRSFSASRFWDEVIASQATAFIYIGEICRYLLNQPEKPTDRAHAARCRLELDERGWIATPLPRQGSHILTSMVAADCLALIPTETASLNAGDPVEIELLDRPR